MEGSARAEFDRGLDILERRIIADKIVEMAEVAQRKLRETEQELAQERKRAMQEREESERQRQETEQKLAQERERSIAAMRALGMSNKDIDKIYPDK
ncbi:hypothetical protein FACS1894200_13590 [Spirochaetia bacterium]|nr:hypothetical protein FACS1894200_13590 [Spirochaetia bacterium]